MQPIIDSPRTALTIGAVIVAVLLVAWLVMAGSDSLGLLSFLVRLVHVLAAMVWVGGQIVLAAPVPAVRRAGGADSLRAVARRFQFVAWPAFVALVATGIWNLMEVDVGDRSSAYLTTLSVKLVLVVVSGACAFGHTMLARLRPALGGALAGIALLAALGTTFLGVLITTG